MTKILVEKALLEQLLDALDGAEQMRPENPTAWEVELTAEDIDRISVELRAVLSEPSVEPVAWRYKYLNFMGQEVWHTVLPRDGKVLEAQPLYTSPPQPASVPMLTDEEFEAIRKTCAYQFAEACRSGTTKAKTIMQSTEAAVRQKAGL